MKRLLASLLILVAANAGAGTPPKGADVDAKRTPASSPLTIAQPAPPFQLRTIDGSLIRLDQIAYSGKEKSWAKKQPLLLDFFRTDCAPCRQAMPKLTELEARYGKDGLKVIVVALLEPEEGREKLERYLAELKPTFPVVIDEAEHWSKKYLGERVELPAMFLVDREGLVTFKSNGAKEGDELSAAIARVLGKKS
ncbi:MAG: TlpA family protein disulfide reductase [Deltaproteobacteria bacterium]|nr:TlpA family protein disulfide reductase [Deltaproteobacteria bacterium]